MRPFLVALVAAALFGAGGCLGPGLVSPSILGPAVDVVKMGGSSFSNGVLTGAFARSFDDVGPAAEGVVRELGLKPRLVRRAAGYLFMSMRDETDTEITVRVQSRASMITTVRIKVGFLGNQPFSQLLMDHIETRLVPASSDAQTPAAPEDTR